jgi:hypothetical protein
VAETEFTQEDIERLGRRLDELVDGDERTMLAGIIAVAAEAIRSGRNYPGRPEVIHANEPEPRVTVDVQGDGDLPSLRKQIADAFTPGPMVEVAHAALNVKVGHVASVRVGRNP